jgi:hypothetical protein
MVATLLQPQQARTVTLHYTSLATIHDSYSDDNEADCAEQKFWKVHRSSLG